MASRLIWVLFLTATLFTYHSVELNLHDLIKSNRNFFRSASERVRLWGTPFSGEEGIRSDIRLAAQWFRKYAIQAYDVGPSYLGDQGPDQRLVEVVWPARYQAQEAEYRFRRERDPRLASCEELERGEGIVLDCCLP